MRRLGLVAGAIAIVLFVCNAFGGVVSRLNWPLSGANAEGIFLVIAWFALRALKSDDMPDRVLRHGEPVILVALALTLSLGSFGALVIGAIAMLLYGKRDRTWGAVGADAAVMVVKLAIGVGTGPMPVPCSVLGRSAALQRRHARLPRRARGVLAPS